MYICVAIFSAVRFTLFVFHTTEFGYGECFYKHSCFFFILHTIKSLFFQTSELISETRIQNQWQYYYQHTLG